MELHSINLHCVKKHMVLDSSSNDHLKDSQQEKKSEYQSHLHAYLIISNYER